MTTKNNPGEAPSGSSIVITRVFKAPRHLVFEAWTKDEHLKKWSAPRGFTIPDCGGDPRPGGEWRCCMVAPDGSKHFLSGVYQQVVQDELLVFTHAWLDAAGKPGPGTLVTVRFADEGDGTRVTLEQTGFTSIESRDGHRGGWSECFELLAELLEKNPNP